jgi:hypothetical protein
MSERPDGSRNPWMEAMRRGEFRRAWRISDRHLAAHLARGEPSHRGPRHFQCIWNGQALTDKRVLVRCYHGLGDTIQFVRFAAPLRQLAREVVLWAQPALLRLLETAPGVDRVSPLHDGVPDVSFDCDIEIMELPHALRVSTDSIACAVPYLFPQAPPGGLPRSGSELLVGLVWRAGDWDARRSVSTRPLQQLAHVTGVRLLSFQCGIAPEEAARIPAQDVSSVVVEETAARLRCLDVLISVDTFIAHLAGALGVPVWLLLHSQCDWRWMKDRADSVWYPTMRLFRQQTAGHWAPVIDAVAEALRCRVASRGLECGSVGTNLCI